MNPYLDDKRLNSLEKDNNAGEVDADDVEFLIEAIRELKQEKSKQVTPLVCTTTALIHEGHLVLGYAFQRNDTLGRPLAGGWQMPGGKVGPGEQLEEAAVREVYEEVGILIEPWKLRLFGILRMDDFVTFCYLTHIEGERPQPKDMEPDKNKDWQWWRMNQVETALDDVEGKFADYSIPGPLFPPLRRLLGTGKTVRELRHPGAPTHCMQCLGQLPCRCFRSQWP